MQFRYPIVAASFVALMVGVASEARADVITHFNGPWTLSTTGGGTGEIVDLTGEGGNLENNAPLPTGAVKLTTTDNSDRANVSRSFGFPTVSNIFNSDLSFSYSTFKENTTNTSAAPALKLAFFNGSFSGDGFVQLVFEPTWNQSGEVGNPSSVPAGQWQTFDIGFQQGVFWGTGGFGESNTAGGPPLRTLSQWQTAFDTGSTGAFSDAILTKLTVGQGSFNPDTVGYFDSVNASFNGNQVSAADFEVPIPATGWLFGVGLLGLFINYRKSRPHAG